jgi:hypothetical protein
MIFDQLCDMAEAWRLPIAALLEQACLIRTDLVPHQALAQRIPQRELVQIARAFRLPHRITAIEDAASCIVLADVEEGAVGLAAGRLCVECTPSNPLVRPEVYADPIDIRLAIDEICSIMPASAVTISVCRFSSPAQREGSFAMAGGLDSMLIGTTRHLAFTPAQSRALPEEHALDLLSSALRNALTAVEELIHIQRLPAFLGWPAIPEPPPGDRIRRSTHRTVLRAAADGRIERTGGSL